MTGPRPVIDRTRIVAGIQAARAAGVSDADILRHLRDEEGVDPGQFGFVSPGAKFRNPKAPALTQEGEAVVPGPEWGGAGPAERSRTAGEERLGATENALQGLTGRFQDELTGLVNAAGSILPGGRSPGQAYTQERNASRARTKGFQADHPGMALALELAGMAPWLVAAAGPAVTSIGALRAARGVPATAKAISAARAGATAGAVAGGVTSLGAAEGSPLEQIARTAGGTALGATLGAGAPVIRATPTAARAVGRFIGVSTAAGRQAATDRAITEELARTGQTPATASAGAATLKRAGVPEVSVGEAMGPAAPRVTEGMRFGLPDEAAGRATTFAKTLKERVADAGGTESRTGPAAHELYQEARAVGGIDIANDQPAQRAIRYFNSQFPKARNAVLAKLQRQVEDGIIGPDDIIDLTTKQPTVTFWDEYKKYLDAQISGKAIEKPTWGLAARREADRRLADLRNAVDEGIAAKAHADPYLAARTQGAQDIAARKELTANQTELAKSLEATSKRRGIRADFETAAPQAAAARAKIAMADFFRDILKSGIRKTAHKEATSTLDALMQTNPEAFFSDLATRQTAQRAAQLGRAAKARAGGVGLGALAPYLFGRRP